MSGMKTAPLNLDKFLLLMRYKLELRRKRPPDPKKWPVAAVDENGDRDWNRCPMSFLTKKMSEELGELYDEVEYADHAAEVAMEAADVALVAFMIAERYGIDWQKIIDQLPRRTVHRAP